MRRILATLTASAVLIPLAVTAAPGAASAATNTLTVHAISRDGSKLKTRISVVNLGTNVSYKLTSGTARKLPKGTYVAMGELASKDGTTTVGGRTVKVSGRSATTIDARKGKRFTIAVSPAPADSWGSIRARVCAPTGSITSQVEVYTDPGKLYVIPNSSSNLRLAYAAQWQNYSAATSYVVAGGFKGLPKSYQRTVKRSSLADVTMNLRSGVGLTTDTSISAQSAAGGCLGGMYLGIDRVHAPKRYKVYLSPGKWDLSAETIADTLPVGHQVKRRTLEGGKSYSQSFGRSAWGPGVNLPLTLHRRLNFDISGMFEDPFSYNHNHQSGVKASVTLTKGGKVVKKQTRHTFFDYENALFTPKLPSAGWYGLTVEARRYHPDMANPSWLLSNRTTAKFRFHADPARNRVTPVYLTRFAPNGLDLRNSAKPGSTTTVDLTPNRPRQQSDAKPTTVTIKTVAAQVSFDNGKTWRSVPLKKSGGKWVATVKNPASGYVTLRAKVTDTKGNFSDIIVYRAYRIA